MLNSALPLVLASLVLASAARAQGSDPSQDARKMGSPAALPQGQTVESMWPAPTADDWEKPVLVTWQRTFEDAFKVAAELGKPVLVCVNMDGEPASEHWAGIKYRTSETARLLEPYVCLVASVYRHSPRDHDEEGRRIPCPRFGGVTCGEHITLEPILYEKYFEGQRIAPRHILLERDGTKGYDVFYSWDTASVANAFAEGVKDRPKPVEPGERSLEARLQTADVNERLALEKAYLTGSHTERRTLLETTLKARVVDQLELLRLALFGLDVELARLARRALAQCESEEALDLIAEALKAPMDDAERELLVAAAERLSEKFPRGRTLVAVQRGLVARSARVDVEAWRRTAEGEYRAGALASQALESAARTSEAVPTDGAARLALAESLLARAHDAQIPGAFTPLFELDADRAAREAEASGVSGWRLDAVLAVTSLARGQREEAVRRALAAFEGGMPRPGEEGMALDDASSVALLALFAEARQKAIAQAYRERKPWPGEWLADVHAAYAVLVTHPRGTEQHAADGYDFLRWLGATARAREVLERGLTRFPASWRLHERLRGALVVERGPDGLESEYAARLARAEAPPELGWFAAYASLVAAETHRRGGARDRALAAYERALTLYEQDLALHPEHEASVDHYSALALAGRAHVFFELGDLARATDGLVLAFERAPRAAAAFDGLGRTPIDSARILLARLEERGEAALYERLQTRLAGLGRELLDRPDRERGVPNEAARAGDRPLPPRQVLPEAGPPRTPDSPRW